jgi:hypothetical protein
MHNGAILQAQVTSMSGPATNKDGNDREAGLLLELCDLLMT